MAKIIVSTTNAPEAVGAYSQAVAANGFVFCSGQIALDPETGELLSGSIAEETARCLKNLGAILDSAGTSFVHVVKVNAYLTDMGAFQEFNDAYAAFFGDEPPARAAIGVAQLPKGARVEIECVAIS